MKVRDLVKFSVRSVFAHKLESFFIILALAIGVSMVTTTLAFLMYSSRQLNITKASIYMRGISVESKTANWRVLYEDGTFQPVAEIGRVGDKGAKFLASDLETIRKASPAVQYAYLQQPIINLPEFGKPEIQKWEDNDFIATVFTPDYIVAQNLKLIRGSLITPEEYRSHKNVALITEWLAKKHFGTKNPIGQILKFDYIGKMVAFRVVGVVQPQAGDFSFKSDQLLGGISILLPWGSAGGTFPMDLSRLDLQLNFVSFVGKTDEAYSQILSVVEKRYGSGATIRRNDVSRARSIQKFSTIALIITILGSSGLLLSALNITNLMLARVISRSEQIGISMALGASKRQIFAVYLSESLFLGIIGGTVGIGLSALLTMAATSALNTLGNPLLQIYFEPAQAMIGMGLALCVGVLFGFYPAISAAKTSTADMLRST
ncbi:MAG: FtsX-like permease family protein [Deinococcaceae bacterium]